MERILNNSSEFKEESHSNLAKLITFVDDFRKTFTKSNIIQKIEDQGNLEDLMNESIKFGIQKYEQVFGQSKVS
jgi:hypothetical protein